MIDALLLFSNQIKSQTLPSCKRFLYKKIDFNERLIGIIGSRGAGKSNNLSKIGNESILKHETYCAG